MAKTIGGYTRTIALWVMILSVIAADTLLWINGQKEWAIFWVLITALVVVFELYGVFISKQKRTISNMWKAWAQEKPFWAYLTLGILWLGLSALCLHLAVW